MAARILPSVDGRPGAHEAGVIYFIDRALSTFNADHKKHYADGIANLNRRASRKCAKREPDRAKPQQKAASFVALTPLQQDELLHAIEKTEFFKAVRLDTIAGTFALPAWGGNRDYAGWHLPGFEHQPRFQPPFGYYDGEINRRSLTMAQTRQRTQFQPSETVDFVIVGSGAAGGIIAKELSTAGFSVVVLEQGPRLTESQFDHDEFGTFARSHNCNDPLLQPQTFRATPSEKAKKALSLIYGRLVGGSNAHYTGYFWRLRPSDFNEASVLGRMKGTGLADWPITYEELEPYYTKAEWELGVSGEPGPFDPPRSRAYPMPISFALQGLPPGSPTWGEDFARSLAEQFSRTMLFATHGTSLPVETNSVTLDPQLKDAWGVPCMRVTYEDHPDDLKCSAFLTSHAMEIAKAVGALKVWAEPIQPQT